MALGTLLPIWPAILFAYIEPFTTLLGWNDATNNPASFVHTQVPSATSKITPLTPSVEVLSLAIGNVYLLCGLFAMLALFISREARVAKSYFMILLVGDVGHLYAFYKVMGPDMFWGYKDYTPMMWGNIGLTAFLTVNRVLLLSGVFGRIGRR